MSERILIVDDSDGARESLTAILSDEGHVCRGAASGAEALQALRDGSLT